MNSLISVLSGDIWDDGGIWRTKDVDTKTGGTLPFSFRIPAAAVLAGESGVSLFVQGGLAEGVRPSLASVMHRELCELGVPEESLLKEETTTTTYQQLLALQEAAHTYDSASISILSNEWHLPRIAAMLKHISALSALHARGPRLISAEEVLLDADAARWQEQIEEARQSSETHVRKSLERKGVEDIAAGRYHFR